MNTTPQEHRLATHRDLGRAFFAAQDRLHGGPDPELCSPDYTARIGGGAPVDRAGHEGFARAFYAAFPDVRHELERVVAGDDHVVVRAHLVGTHTAAFFGIPATGRPISVALHVIMELRDGKVSKLFGLFDEAGLLRQLGVLPAS